MPSIKEEGIGIPPAPDCAEYEGGGNWNSTSTGLCRVLRGRELEFHQHRVVQSIKGEGIGIPPAQGCAEY